MEYLVDNEKDKLAILVLCGSYIEGCILQHRLPQLLQITPSFLQIIAHQKNSLNELIGVIDPIREDVDVTDIYKGLVDLSKIFENVGDTLTADQLEQLMAAIEPLRESIV